MILPMVKLENGVFYFSVIADGAQMLVKISRGSVGEAVPVVTEGPVVNAIRFDIEQTLTDEEKEQARENIGITTPVTLNNLLKDLFSAAVYTSDQSANIAMLTALLTNTSTEKHSITRELIFVTIDNSATSVVNGNPYVAIVSEIDGYRLDAVKVVMSGIDITDLAYDGDGKITIPAVTGAVVITATAVGAVQPVISDIVMGSFQLSIPSLKIYTNQNNRAIVVAPQYVVKGQKYRFSLGEAATAFYYSAVFVKVNSASLDFAYTGSAVDLGNVVEEKLFSTSWTQADAEYAVAEDNVVLLVNFKRTDDAYIHEYQYDALKTNFTAIAEV